MDTIKPTNEASNASGSLKRLVNQHPLSSYFFLAYAISWLLSIPVILEEWGYLPRAILVIFFTLKSFGPALSAIIMIRMTEGQPGLDNLRNRVKLWRVGWQWYFLVMLGIPLIILAGLILLPGVLASWQGIKPVFYSVNYLINFVLIFFGGGPLGEEPGWRGYALPRMLPRFGVLKANLLLGVLWTGWHLPDFLTSAQGGGPGAGLSPFYTRLPIFFVMVMALTFIFTWIFNHTNGSIFIMLLLHTTFNTFAGTLPMLFSAPIIASNDLPFTIGPLALAILLLIFTRGQLGYLPNTLSQANITS